MLNFVYARQWCAVNPSTPDHSAVEVSIPKCSGVCYEETLEHIFSTSEYGILTKNRIISPKPK